MSGLGIVDLGEIELGWLLWWFDGTGVAMSRPFRVMMDYVGDTGIIL